LRAYATMLIFLPRLSNRHPPMSASQVAGMTEVSHQARQGYYFAFNYSCKYTVN
jgi:hypothetical protein